MKTFEANLFHLRPYGILASSPTATATVVVIPILISYLGFFSSRRSPLVSMTALSMRKVFCALMVTPLLLLFSSSSLSSYQTDCVNKKWK